MVFRANSDSECSACLSGLLTYIVLPCTPSPLTSRCQLTPPAPSPLAHELIHATAALPVAACECRRRPRNCLRPSLHEQQPPPPARAPSFARPQVHTLPPPLLLLPFFLAAHVSTAAAARGPWPGYPAPDTTYVTAAAAPVAALIPQPSRHQPLPPATLPDTSTPH
jgi:hypothetical protein